MDTVICDWGLKMAGVKEAEHKYFYAVVAADDGQRRVPRRGLPVGASVLGALARRERGSSSRGRSAGCHRAGRKRLNTRPGRARPGYVLSQPRSVPRCGAAGAPPSVRPMRPWTSLGIEPSPYADAWPVGEVLPMSPPSDAARDGSDGTGLRTTEGLAAAVRRRPGLLGCAAHAAAPARMRSTRACATRPAPSRPRPATPSTPPARCRGSASPSPAGTSRASP